MSLKIGFIPLNSKSNYNSNSASMAFELNKLYCSGEINNVQILTLSSHQMPDWSDEHFCFDKQEIEKFSENTDLILYDNHYSVLESKYVYFADKILNYKTIKIFSDFSEEIKFWNTDITLQSELENMPIEFCATAIRFKNQQLFYLPISQNFYKNGELSHSVSVKLQKKQTEYIHSCLSETICKLNYFGIFTLKFRGNNKANMRIYRGYPSFDKSSVFATNIFEEFNHYNFHLRALLDLPVSNIKLKYKHFLTIHNLSQEQKHYQNIINFINTDKTDKVCSHKSDNNLIIYTNTKKVLNKYIEYYNNFEGI